MGKIPKNVETPTYIYVLKDPDTQLIRYVGKTIRTLKCRLQQHIRTSTHNKHAETHKTRWIQKLSKENKQPLIEQIEIVPWKESAEREMYWIDYYKKQGCNLVNTSVGGEGTLGYKWTEQARKNHMLHLDARSYAIYKYDLDGNYIEECSSKLCKTVSHLCDCLSGKRLCAAGFMWSRKKVDKLPSYKEQQYLYRAKAKQASSEYQYLVEHRFDNFELTVQCNTLAKIDKAVVVFSSLFDIIDAGISAEALVKYLQKKNSAIRYNNHNYTLRIYA